MIAYLTLGLPIISSEIRTAYRLQPHVRMASDKQSWLEAIDESLHEKSAALRRAWQKESLQHTWDARAAVLLNWLNGLQNA